jgi:hypothetical protein
MDAIRDFQDLLLAFAEHHVRYLIVGGLAFIYHAKPRFTKDINLWVEPEPENIDKANAALSAFGSPCLLSHNESQSILQIGLPPNRIDLIQTIEGVSFRDAWERRDVAPYGEAPANWIDLDSLLTIKERIDDPRHQADARDLRRVRELKRRNRAQQDGL